MNGKSRSFFCLYIEKHFNQLKQEEHTFMANEPLLTENKDRFIAFLMLRDIWQMSKRAKTGFSDCRRN
jgi:hypothetical protein